MNAPQSGDAALEELASNISAPCLLVDFDQVILRSNAGFERLSGWQPKEVEGGRLKEFFATEDSLGSAGEAASRPAGSMVKGSLALRGGGSVEASAFFSRLESGQGGLVLMLFHDIYFRNSLEFFLREISRLLSRSYSEAELPRQILLSALKLSGADGGSILRLSEGGRETRVVGMRESLPFGEKRGEILKELDQGVAEDGNCFWFHDVPLSEGEASLPEFLRHQEKISAFHMPLKTRDNILGSLEIFNNSEKARLSHGDIDLLGLFAGTAAVILENHAARQVLEKENLLWKKLHEAVHRLSTGREAAQTAEGVLGEALKLTGAEFGLLLEYDPTAKAFRPGAFQGLQMEKIQAYSQDPISREHHAALMKLLKKEAGLTLADLDSHAALRDCFPKSLAAFLCVPLSEAGDLLAVLFLGGQAAGAAEEGGLEQTLKLFSAQAAAELKQSRLINELRRQQTALENATASLVKAEKLATAGQLAAGVAHQIRNPLSIISANIQMMLMKTGPSDPNRAILEMLLEKIEETDQTVKELMEIGKPLKLDMKKAPLSKSLMTVEQFILARCREQKVEMETRLAEMPEVWLDETQFQRCLLDLCLNALQAMPEGGSLLVKAAATPEGVTVEVEDTGPGIPRENLAKVFDPFFTTKAKGNGLGLYNTKRICDEMGVKLEAENIQPHGACFRFSFLAGQEKPLPFSRRVEQNTP